MKCIEAVACAKPVCIHPTDVSGSRKSALSFLPIVATGRCLRGKWSITMVEPLYKLCICWLYTMCNGHCPLRSLSSLPSAVTLPHPSSYFSTFGSHVCFAAHSNFNLVSNLHQQVRCMHDDWATSIQDSSCSRMKTAAGQFFA